MKKAEPTDSPLLPMKSEVRALTIDATIDPKSDQNLDKNGVENFNDFLMFFIALGLDLGFILAPKKPQEKDKKTI